MGRSMCTVYDESVTHEECDSQTSPNDVERTNDDIGDITSHGSLTRSMTPITAYAARAMMRARLASREANAATRALVSRNASSNDGSPNAREAAAARAATTTTTRTATRAHHACANGKIIAAPMVYVSGEEMTAYVMDLIVKKWIEPHVDTSKWERFDLRAKNRDDTQDKVLRDVIEAGKRVKSIFKEPTVTPTADQVKRLGLKKSWGSPNGAMRKGWNGITIARDTIHIEGVELGYKKQVYFERHAVGGEYSAGFKNVGRGKLVTTFTPSEGPDAGKTIEVDARQITDAEAAVVVYHNPYDNVYDLARIFFNRCLEAKITPYVVTKKTVFKWQEPFWQIMKKVYDEEFKQKFVAAGVTKPKDELVHLLSDAATMKLVQWTQGGFGMAAHNYDGDVLTDELAQMHKSPGFITSNLVGVDENGVLIKEFEASHGTVADMDEARLRGEETSLNPLGMVEGLIGAMNHAAEVHNVDKERTLKFTTHMRKSIHQLFREGKGTRDLSGPSGATTEAFIEAVAKKLENHPPM